MTDKKLTWCDVLCDNDTPKREWCRKIRSNTIRFKHHSRHENPNICSEIEALQQAERDGKVILNPPSEDELLKLIELVGENSTIKDYKGFNWKTDLSKAISKRLKEGV